MLVLFEHIRKEPLVGGARGCRSRNDARRMCTQQIRGPELDVREILPSLHISPSDQG